MNHSPGTTVSKRTIAQNKYNRARSTLGLMLLLTLANLVLFAIGSDRMMLFSVTVPYYAVVVGLLSEIPPLMTAGIVLSAVSMLAYLLCWLLSKKHCGWMIAALVLFTLDTLCLAGLYLLIRDASGILDFAIHIWMLSYLAIGVKSGLQLKNLPEEEAAPPVSDPEPTMEAAAVNSTPLRFAERDVKFRVLLESNTLGHRICYRRVKRVNELVVDGYVYDQVEMLFETAHTLTAVIDGRTIQVGYDGRSNSFLRIDGEAVAKKLRIY